MAPDVIEHVRGSLVQHGALNDRIYLMKLDPAGLPGLAGELVARAEALGYSKIFAKVPGGCAEPFLAEGFVDEARVPGLYRAEEEARFLARYLDPSRAVPADAARLEDVLATARKKARRGRQDEGRRQGYEFIRLDPGHVDEMAALYDAVFDSYPFPIHDPGYLRETMASHVVYFGARAPDGSLAALSSAETDRQGGNAEMTDFATGRDHRGKGLAGRLLGRMEREMAAEGMPTVYTIARAEAYPVNIVFARHGYEYAGTLVNNTNIAGRFESMNVWYKTLA